MRQVEFINEARTHARVIWEATLALKALQTEWNALDYSNTLSDGIGQNDKVLRVDVGAVVFDTTDALVAVLDTGHATNLAKLL